MVKIRVSVRHPVSLSRRRAPARAALILLATFGPLAGGPGVGYAAVSVARAKVTDEHCKSRTPQRRPDDHRGRRGDGYQRRGGAVPSLSITIS